MKAAVLSVTFPCVSIAVELTDADLDLIDRFEAESRQSFKQFFTDVVHQRETCLETNDQCDVDLQKRTSDFDVIFLEDTSLKSRESKEMVARRGGETLRDIANQTELQPSFKYLNDPANYVAILFADIDVRFADVEGFLTGNTAPEHFTDRGTRTAMFQAFVESDAPLRRLLAADLPYLRKLNEPTTRSSSRVFQQHL